MVPLREALRRERWMRAAVILWGLPWALRTISVIREPEHIGVYPIFAAAARHWWAGLPLYERYPVIDLFRYPPTFALAFSPFGLAPVEIGSSLWNLVSVAVLFYSLRVLVARVFPWTWTTRQEGIFLALALLGNVRGIWAAQSNALLFALTILGVAAVLEKRWWRAALFLSLPVAIKIWPLALVMLLSVRWARPLVPRFLAMVTGLAALPFLTRSWVEVVGEYRAFWDHLAHTGSRRWPGSRDLWTIWEQLGVPDADLYLVLRLAAAGLVFAWCWWQARRLPSERHLASAILASWITWQLLLGPGTERLTYGVIAPFTSAALLLAFEHRRLRASGTAAWSMTTVLGTGAAERALQPFLFFAPAIQPAGVIAYLIWLTRWDWAGPPLDGSGEAEIPPPLR